MRHLVAQSWERCAAAGIDADRAQAPLRFERSELLDYRAGHALSSVFPLLYDVLGRAAEDCDCVMAVGDTEGQLLWVCGRPAVVRKAEGINFVEGTRWAEELIGTNAPGTALRLDSAVQISSREHFTVAYKDWSCSAAPIHDPATGRILGVVDVTGGDLVDLPQTLAMVRSAARMAEAELGRLLVLDRLDRLDRSRSTRSRHPVPRPELLRLTGLGRPDCQVELRGQVARLSRRHGDLMAVLADTPEGISADRLALEVYDEEVQPSTMRAQITRLRGLLGHDVLASRPYRLCLEARSDWAEVSEALHAGRLADAVRLYRGPLLPASAAPGVVRRREELDRELTAALLACADPDLLVAATRGRWGADHLDLWEHLVELLPTRSPLRATSLNEVRRLRIEYGLEPSTGLPPILRSRVGRL